VAKSSPDMMRPLKAWGGGGRGSELCGGGCCRVSEHLARVSVLSCPAAVSRCAPAGMPQCTASKAAVRVQASVCSQPQLSPTPPCFPTKSRRSPYLDHLQGLLLTASNLLLLQGTAWHSTQHPVAGSLVTKPLLLVTRHTSRRTAAGGTACSHTSCCQPKLNPHQKTLNRNPCAVHHDVQSGLDPGAEGVASP
jgi:hypothetical protein